MWVTCIYFPLKKYIRMIVYEHMETLRCVCVCVWKRERGYVMHVWSVSLQYWRLMFICFQLVIFWCHFTCDNSKTWIWMWSSRLPAHTAGAEQLQCLALKTATSLLPWDHHDVSSGQWKLNRINIWHLLNQAWQCLVCDAYLKGCTPKSVCVSLGFYLSASVCVCDTLRFLFVCVCEWRHFTYTCSCLLTHSHTNTHTQSGMSPGWSTQTVSHLNEDTHTHTKIHTEIHLIMQSHTKRYTSYTNRIMINTNCIT